MSSKPVYLDYAATTPVDPEVIPALIACLGPDGVFGNPASHSHSSGNRAKAAVEQARREVAALIGAVHTDVIWTSGATESNNLALKGLAEKVLADGTPCHIITSCLEHKAILDTVTHLETLGVEATRLMPDATGAITADAVANAMRPHTRMVSLMIVNNEIGTLTDVAAVAKVAHAGGALLHVDAAQGLGKVDIDVVRDGIDLLSMSAHKIYGPKGIGALYVKGAIKDQIGAQIHGGGHEQGLRSGTLATHQIVGMGSACAVAQRRLAEDHAHIAALSRQLLRGLADVPAIRRNGAAATCIPNIISLCIDLPGFMPMLLGGELEVSSTSACNSASGAVSHVLTGIGLTTEAASRSVRISLGRFTTVADVERAVLCVRNALAFCTPAKSMASVA
ncbi:cysteine desulfurase [Robbsia andropogonis]